MTDYVTDVKKYVSNVDEEAVAGLVRHYGIALRNRDSSLVAASDPAELARLRDRFLKKKLQLTDGDDALDAAIAEVMETMKGDRSKSRVTVSYILAEKYGKLDMFHKKTKK
ncbi:MAG: DUF2853 family protein [Hyphomicrobiaceae bacterium]|nr:DUF2853 family protein [Hyphomicrobiaceae bacterium]